MSKEILENIYNQCDRLNKDQIVTLIKQGVIKLRNTIPPLPSEIEEVLTSINDRSDNIFEDELNEISTAFSELQREKEEYKVSYKLNKSLAIMYCTKLDKIKEVVNKCNKAQMQTIKNSGKTNDMLETLTIIEIQSILEEE